MIVVDASAVLDLLLRTKRSGSLMKRMFEEGQTLHAPHLVDLEVLQVLRRYAIKGILTLDRAEEARADFGDLAIERYPHDIFLDRIWMLRDNITAYDGAYVTLAEALGAPLLTTDSRLAHSSGHEAAIELIEN